MAVRSSRSIRQVDETAEAGFGGEIGEPEFGRFGLIFRPFDQKLKFWPRLITRMIAMGWADVLGGAARDEIAVDAGAPKRPESDLLPGWAGSDRARSSAEIG